LILHQIEQLHQKWEALPNQFAHNKNQQPKISTNLQKTQQHLHQLPPQLHPLHHSLHSLQQVLLLSTKHLQKLQ
ncbi:hypothetical protein, partial [Bacillus cereus]|uniref:hypothetical protein n=1 Tax=Bacillus cereus TaxID=1396 RepID=UPI001C9317BF